MSINRNRTPAEWTALIMRNLDDEHCDYCDAMATGLQPWWSDPDTVYGHHQIAELVAHMADTYRRIVTEDRVIKSKPLRGRRQ